MDPAVRHRTLQLLGLAEERTTPHHISGEPFKYKHGWLLLAVADVIAKLNGDRPDKQHLAEAVQSGTRRAGPYQLGTHGRSRVSLADFGNGTEGLVTTYLGHDAKRHADADQLASDLARSIGVPAPRTLRVAPDRSVHELVDGSTWAEREAGIVDNPRPYELPVEVDSPTFDKGFYGYAPAVKETAKLQKEDLAAEREKMLASDAGLRLGLLDLLLGVDERDSGTIVVGPDGVVPVQNDGAWAHADQRIRVDAPAGRQSRADGKVPPVQRRISPDDIVTWPQFSEIRSWKDNRLTPADIAFLRQQLDAVRPEFERLGRMRWWQFASDRLDAVAPHAHGTVNLFAGR